MKVKQLFSSEKRWVKHTYATDKNGAACGVQSDKAFSFCLDGALSRCYTPNGKYWDVRTLVDVAIKKMTRGRFSGVVRWNDYPRRTFKQVRKLIEDLNI